MVLVVNGRFVGCRFGEGGWFDGGFGWLDAIRFVWGGVEWFIFVFLWMFIGLGVCFLRFLVLNNF